MNTNKKNFDKKTLRRIELHIKRQLQTFQTFKEILHSCDSWKTGVTRDCSHDCELLGNKQTNQTKKKTGSKYLRIGFTREHKYEHDQGLQHEAEQMRDFKISKISCSENKITVKKNNCKAKNIRIFL